MSKELTIDSIINTYELSQGIKDNVKRISNRRIEELGLGRYESIYSYIASLVDKFQVPYKERFFINIIELIKDKRFSPESNFLEENFEKENFYMSLEEIIDILDSYLDPSLLDLIKQLGNENKNELKFNTSPGYLMKNVSEIQKKLETLLQEYGESLPVITRRPIKKIKFSPSLKIKFGYRRYNGNPLAFFIENRKFYPEDLSRAKLSEIDSGLYKCLLKYNQIEAAVPETVFVSSEKRNRIIMAYNKCRNSIKVAKALDVSPKTVRKYWKEYFKIKNLKKLSEEKKKEIIEAYKKCPSGRKVAMALDVSPNTVWKYLKKNKV